MQGDLYCEPGKWQQIKGDPAIRGTVFQHTRVESLLDRNIDQAFSILEELLVERGMFQGVLHLPSSRATIWVIDDPYRYRILQSDALSDPDICMAYPLRPYPGDAEIPADQIRPVLSGLKALRFADDMSYLRSASLNIFNGLISLTFSCDGSHYMPYTEFLDKEAAFWCAAGWAAHGGMTGRLAKRGLVFAAGLLTSHSVAGLWVLNGLCRVLRT